MAKSTTTTLTKPPEPDEAPEPTPSDTPARTDADREADNDERADYVARSIVGDIAPAAAREQAVVARRRASAEDPEQAAVDARLAELLDAKADEWDKQRELERKSRGRTRGRATTHGPGSAPVGSDIPHAIKRGDQIAYHTSPDVPDQFGWVVRLHPEADDNKRYLADLFIVPVVEGSSAATVTNVTYGPGLGQFSELPKDEDDIGRGSEGNTIHKPWQGG
jgi:hypothetical protein